MTPLSHKLLADQPIDPSSAGRLAAWLAAICLLAACGQTNNASGEAAGTLNDSYAGSAACADCHATATADWRDSHHDLAMQEASADTVLGDFADSLFAHNGITSRFYADGGKYWVETDGPDGKIAAFPIIYTFGLYPLQQYLVELPNGKIQALGIAWDSRPAAQGGQHWFHVYGDERIDYQDVLHWTQPSQNWETMCADCHSTALTSIYSVQEDRFATTWSELNVGCEACHGPGKEHIEWANDDQADEDKGLQVRFDERKNISWAGNPDTGNSTRSEPRTTHIEINACAGCHSRRSRLAEGTHPASEFLDLYAPSLIVPPLYHADGQILDEVYVYGSFMQSRMQQMGVTCSDCHNPHSLDLKAPGAGVCLQCHSPATFATSEHQLHAAEVANCIDCHMPATTYMQIDARNDHSFRVPRPDLSVAYGTPNACNNCHTDRTPQWATEVLQSAGRSPSPDELHWSELLAAIASGQSGSQEAAAALATDENAPAIIRASAASQLRLADSPGARELLNKLLSDPDPLVRWAMAQLLANSQPALASRYGEALLEDNTLAVRAAAASALANIDPVLAAAVPYQLLQQGTDEYLAAQNTNIERAEAHINIANIRRAQGKIAEAEQAFTQAILLNPSFAPAYINLADLYRELDREGEAAATLNAGLSKLPDQPDLEHALGLSYVRQGKIDAALPLLRSAAKSNSSPRYTLVYAVALHSEDRTSAAIEALKDGLEEFGNNAELERALADYSAQLSQPGR